MFVLLFIRVEAEDTTEDALNIQPPQITATGKKDKRRHKHKEGKTRDRDAQPRRDRDRSKSRVG